MHGPHENGSIPATTNASMAGGTDSVSSSVAASALLQDAGMEEKLPGYKRTLALLTDFEAVGKARDLAYHDLDAPAKNVYEKARLYEHLLNYVEPGFDAIDMQLRTTRSKFKIEELKGNDLISGVISEASRYPGTSVIMQNSAYDHTIEGQSSDDLSEKALGATRRGFLDALDAYAKSDSKDGGVRTTLTTASKAYSDALAKVGARIGNADILGRTNTLAANFDIEGVGSTATSTKFAVLLKDALYCIEQMKDSAAVTDDQINAMLNLEKDAVAQLDISIEVSKRNKVLTEKTADARNTELKAKEKAKLEAEQKLETLKKEMNGITQTVDLLTVESHAANETVAKLAEGASETEKQKATEDLQEATDKTKKATGSLKDVTARHAEAQQTVDTLTVALEAATTQNKQFDAAVQENQLAQLSADTAADKAVDDLSIQVQKVKSALEVAEAQRLEELGAKKKDGAGAESDAKASEDEAARVVARGEVKVVAQATANKRMEQAHVALERRFNLMSTIRSTEKEVQQAKATVARLTEAVSSGTDAAAATQLEAAQEKHNLLLKQLATAKGTVVSTPDEIVGESHVVDKVADEIPGVGNSHVVDESATHRNPVGGLEGTRNV